MLDLYYIDISPPCRAVLLTASALGLKINKKYIDLFEKEQMKPEFLKINPQHSVPTIVDGNHIMWESRAICTYLASQYGKDDSLYPRDPKEKALVDRLMYFDAGTLYHRFMNFAGPIIFGNEKPDPAKLEKVHEALGWLDGFLVGHDYAAGNCITVADHSLVASVSSMEEAKIDLSKHSNVTAWLARCKENMTEYESSNGIGATKFGHLGETLASKQHQA